MIKQQVDVLFMDGELMLGDTLRLYKGDNGILISVKVEKQYYKNNKLIIENLIELGKYGRAIIRKGQHDCPIHNEENEEPVYCSEVAKIKDGRLDILIPKEAIDETSEMGIYQIQIQLFGNDTDLGRPRLTLDPFEFEACDLISDDLELDEPIFTDDPIVGIGEASEAILREDGDLPIKLEDGSFNKTEWQTNDVITAGRLNKMENAMKTVYGIRTFGLVNGSLNVHIANIINSLTEFPTLDTLIRTVISGNVHVELSDGSQVLINEGTINKSEAEISFLLANTVLKQVKVKFSLTTNKALIIGDFTMNMGDEKAILDNDKIHIIEGVDMTGIATETYVVDRVDEAIDSIDTLEVTTIGNDGIMLLADGDGYEIFDLNPDNIKPNQENHFVFKKVKIPCKDANGNDNTLYFDDTFVCITVIDGIVYEIKEFRSGIVHSITKSENNNVLEYSSRPMTDVEYEHLRDITKIEEANAIEYFKNYFTRDGLYYFGNVSIKCIVGGKSKIVYFNERLVEITIYNSYLTLYDYKDCLIYKFNHNGSKITGFVGQGDLTDAHETRLNEKVSSAINNNVVPVYATKKELNDAISNIDIPEVDVSNLATKEELFSKDYNDLDNKPEIPSVEGLASEEFVSEAVISSIDGFKEEFPYKVLDGIVINDATMFKDVPKEVYFCKGDVSVDVVHPSTGIVLEQVYFTDKLVEIEFKPGIGDVCELYITELDSGIQHIFLSFLNLNGGLNTHELRSPGVYNALMDIEAKRIQEVYATKDNIMGVVNLGDEYNTQCINDLLDPFSLENGFYYYRLKNLEVLADGSSVWYFTDNLVTFDIYYNENENIHYMSMYDITYSTFLNFAIVDGNWYIEGQDHFVTRSGIYDVINSEMPIKRIYDVTIRYAGDFPYMDPAIYFLRNVTIEMADGNSYYFNDSTVTAYRDDYTIYIKDHSKCREIYLNCNGSSINSISVDRLFTSISREFTVKRVDYPPLDRVVNLMSTFGGDVNAILITPGFNARNSNGELIAFKFGKYYDSLVYYNPDTQNKKFTIYSYEEMKTYTFSYSRMTDIPTLVSIESNDTIIQELGGFAEYVETNFATKDELATQIGDIESILKSINGEEI